MKKSFLIFFAIVGAIVNTHAQGSMLPSSDEQAVLAVIQELFDAYRDGDSTRVRSTFTSTAVMQRAFVNRAGERVLTEPSSADKFVGYVGGGLDKLHDEQLWNTSVHVDQHLATVWTDFAFFLDKEFSHCGAENFLLHKIGDDWKIFHLVDTREVDACNVPEAIMDAATK
jgi:hypothetical protein